MATFNVKAHWDHDARVWWAESDDVPGLVAEAETHEELVTELLALIPELLALNTNKVASADDQVIILSNQQEAIYA